MGRIVICKMLHLILMTYSSLQPEEFVVFVFLISSKDKQMRYFYFIFILFLIVCPLKNIAA